MRALEMVHDIDPRAVIEGAVVGLIDEIEPMLNTIVVGTYIRPERTKGGIILSDKSRGEDEYKGKIGLVLKVGPLAFRDDAAFKWPERTPKVGDWIAFRVMDGDQFILGKQPCRLLKDSAVKMIVARPDVLL